MSFGDQIMLLEDLGLGTNEISELDMLNSLFDFPRQSCEDVLSGDNAFEDSADDIIKLSTVISDLGRRPRRRRPRRPRFYPAPYPYPVQYGPSVLPTTTSVVSAKDPESIRRIHALEQKLKELHPKKVKVTARGVEGFGYMPPKVQMQVAAVRKAAGAPASNMAQGIVSNLERKAKKLERIAEKRLQIARSAVKAYQKDKATIDRLDRVSRAKTLKVVESALQAADNPQLARKMDNELTEIRRLNNRAVGLGRRAVANMKLYGAASLLSKNADGQAMLTKAVRNAVRGGDQEAAKVLTASLAKHAETAKMVKGARRRMASKWSGSGKQAKMSRLSGRRERYLKAIALLGKKAETAGLSQEDKRAMRDAYAKLFRVETAMLGVTGGTVMPQKLTNRLQGIDAQIPTFPEYPEPVFSVSLNPNDPSGEYLTDLEAMRASMFSVPDEGDLPAVPGAIWKEEFPGAFFNPAPVQGLDAIRESDFSTRTRNLPRIPGAIWKEDFPSYFAPGFVSPPVQGLDAIRESKFAYQTRNLPRIPGAIWKEEFPGAFVSPPPVQGLDAIREAKFAVAVPPLPPQGQFLERIGLAYFSSGGDLAEDTPIKLSASYNFVPRAAEVKGIKSAVNRAFMDTNALASGATDAVKLVSATDWTSLRKMPPQSLQAAAHSLKQGSKSVSGETWRRAKAIHSYVKSPHNSVCNTLSNSGVRMVGQAAGGSMTSVKYLHKVCGKLGGAGRGVKVAEISPSDRFEQKSRELMRSASENVAGSTPQGQHYKQFFSGFEDLGYDIQKSRLMMHLRAYRRMSKTERRRWRRVHPVTYKQMKQLVKELRAKKRKMARASRKVMRLGQAPETFNPYQPIWTTKRTMEDIRTTEFPVSPEARMVRVVKSKRPRFPKTPQAMWVRHKQGTAALGSLPGGFPNLPQAMWVRHKQRGAASLADSGLPGGFPRLHNPLWVEDEDLSGTTFPTIPQVVWVKKPKMNLLEGAAVAAPLLLT